MRCARVAVLLAVLMVTWSLPFEAYAQLGLPLPNPGSLLVAITSPTAGAIVAGTITVSADASDNVGVVGVQFKLDGNDLGMEDTTNWFSVSWDTTKTTDGQHTLTAVARDAAGNKGVSAPVTVRVDNTPATVSIGEPGNGQTVS